MKKIVMVLLLSLMSVATYAAELCVGDKMIRTLKNNHYKVTILAIYEDNTVDVSYDMGYDNQNISIEELSAPLNRLEEFRVGERAVRTYNKKHFNVKILAVYPNRTADVSYDIGYDNQNISIDELSKPLTSLKSFSVGEKVVRTFEKKHFNVKILAVYPNRTADVSYDIGYDNQNISIDELSKPLYAMSGLKVGQRAVRYLNGKHYKVNILAIYPDRTVDISYDAGFDNQNVSIDELKKPISCIGESCSK